MSLDQTGAADGPEKLSPGFSLGISLSTEHWYFCPEFSMLT